MQYSTASDPFKIRERPTDCNYNLHYNRWQFANHLTTNFLSHNISLPDDDGGSLPPSHRTSQSFSALLVPVCASP